VGVIEWVGVTVGVSGVIVAVDVAVTVGVGVCGVGVEVIELCVGVKVNGVCVFV